MKKGFTLIELLAVIVILAIIALIATPIILNIINDARKESQEKSVELYASAIKNGIVAHQLIEGKKIEDGRYTSETLPFDVEYDGEVECSTIELYEDGGVYIEGCTVNKIDVDYIYGKKQVPFSTDDWSTIVSNIKTGNIRKYNVGDTREISLTGFTNTEADSNGKYTIRIANKTNTGDVCTKEYLEKEDGTKEKYSKTACGFVIEFEDIITKHEMNETNTNVGGYPASLMYTYIQNNIYNALPDDLKDVIIPTLVVSGYGLTSGEENFITTDNIYLLSGKEVYGLDLNDSSSDLTRQLDYYSNLGVTISSYSKATKNLNGVPTYWWLRSALGGNTNFFLYVHNDGFFSSNYAYYTKGVAVAFRIG